MKKSIVTAVALVIVTGAAMATPLITRTGSVNKPLQLLAWANIGYSQTAKNYNWDSTKYLTPTGFVARSTISTDLTFALGLPAGLELSAVLPLASKSEGDSSAMGLSDAMVSLRYGLPLGSLMPLKAALGVGANLPTAPKDKYPPLGDKTTDIGLGLCVNTAKFGIVTGHARAAYWLNGKSNDTTKLGNLLEYLVDADFAVMPKMTPQVAVIGAIQNKKEVNGTAVDKSQLMTHTANLLLLYKPIPMLTIRPKVGMPLAFLSEGGALPNFSVGLDIWVVVP